MNTRRQIIKHLGLVSVWTTPVVHSIMLPAHAMITEVSLPEPTIITLTAVLNQANEVLATGDPASGTATMPGFVNFSVAHIHVGPLGTDGPVIADLTAAIHQTASTQQALCQRQTSRM